MAIIVDADDTRREFSKRSLFASLALTVVFDIGLAILAFSVAQALGASDTVAYLIASVGPLTGMFANWFRTHKLGGVSIIILVTILISAAVSLIGSQDARILLLKDSALTGGFGLVTLISALPIFPKPLMFFFGLKFGTDGMRGGIQEWYDLWDKYPVFRKGQYLINTVWGVSFLLEALIKAFSSLVLPYSVAFTVNQIFPFLVLAAVIFWTIQYGNKQRQQGEERAAQAQQQEARLRAPKPTTLDEPGPTVGSGRSM
ncbi:VC0807 family protein [Arthrobacter sp. GMC3]|uniref:VC0807 family protein n=1 Tax=Arthrobacter sp. GMC3 TaxID=2058894 RepID=UPI000CE5404F|nr:VC0807 family protein [Arthrobacter sp. GMC3]